MTSLHFRVPIEPFGKARPRFTTACGRPVAYTTAKTRSGERMIRQYARRAMGDRYPFPKGTPVRVNVEAAFSIPKSYTKQKHELCAKHDLWPVKKPDIDNIAKAVLDALNDSIFFDDCQVIKMQVSKTFVEGDGYIDVSCEALESEI